MQTILNKIKAVLKVENKQYEQVYCNYANNYYGDQHCQACKK